MGHLSLDPRRSCVKQWKEVLKQSQLLSQILPSNIGAAQCQDHGEQLEAVSIWGGVFITGLRIGILLAGYGMFPLFTNSCSFHANGLHNVSTYLCKGKIKFYLWVVFITITRISKKCKECKLMLDLKLFSQYILHHVILLFQLGNNRRKLGKTMTKSSIINKPDINFQISEAEKKR